MQAAVFVSPQTSTHACEHKNKHCLCLCACAFPAARCGHLNGEVYPRRGAQRNPTKKRPSGLERRTRRLLAGSFFIVCAIQTPARITLSKKWSFLSGAPVHLCTASTMSACVARSLRVCVALEKNFVWLKPESKQRPATKRRLQAAFFCQRERFCFAACEKALGLTDREMEKKTTRGTSSLAEQKK